MLSPTLGLTSSVSRPEWASQWHRPQVNNEYQQVSDDYKLHMQTFGNTVRAVRLSSSKQDSRPCDALRRYVQRAEEILWGETLTLTERFGEQPHAVEQPLTGDPALL